MRGEMKQVRRARSSWMRSSFVAEEWMRVGFLGEVSWEVRCEGEGEGARLCWEPSSSSSSMMASEA